GEQDRHMAAFPFQGAARAQNFLSQVRRRIALSLCLVTASNLAQVVRSVSTERLRTSQRRSALAAKLERRLVLGTTAGAQLDQLVTALAAEFHRRRIVELTV